MKSVAVVGDGVWGNAMLHVIKTNHPDVRMHSRGAAFTEDILALAVPTQAIRSLEGQLASLPPGAIIVNTAKGIEEETHLLPHEIIEEICPSARYMTLIGPGFAGEVMHDMPTLVNLGYGKHNSDFSEVQGILQTDTFRVRPVEAIHILELSAALKNIYAIGCGLAEGLGYETNTRIQLLVLAIEEMQKLFARNHLSAGVESTAGTIGDLVLTCTSSESRNYQFGRFLASYQTQEALAKVNATVEGYYSLDSLESIQKKAGITLPLAEFIREVKEGSEPETVKERFAAFMKRS